MNPKVKKKSNPRTKAKGKDESNKNMKDTVQPVAKSNKKIATSPQVVETLKSSEKAEEKVIAPVKPKETAIKSLPLLQRKLQEMAEQASKSATPVENVGRCQSC